jgi:AraC-like DNA-binding protein
MLYPAAELLRRVAGELAGRPQPTPFFGAPVMDDPELARRLAELHMALEGAAEPLVRETLMVGALAAMVARHADAAPAAPAVAPERAAVARARRYLEDRAAERPTLEDLAEHVGLSPFHLLRVFRQSVGSTPHAYLNHVRVSRARGLLDSGLPPADVALLCGFADQSHLTRAFRRIVGVPPGQYAGMRKIVLDGGG